MLIPILMSIKASFAAKKYKRKKNRHRIRTRLNDGRRRHTIRSLSTVRCDWAIWIAWKACYTASLHDNIRYMFKIHNFCIKKSNSRSRTYSVGAMSVFLIQSILKCIVCNDFAMVEICAVHAECRVIGIVEEAMLNIQPRICDPDDFSCAT